MEEKQKSKSTLIRLIIVMSINFFNSCERILILHFFVYSWDEFQGNYVHMSLMEYNLCDT